MSSPRLVLIIDQFEEVFTQCAGEQERQAFIRALCAARLLVRNLYSTTLQLHSSAAYRGRIMALRVLGSMLDPAAITSPVTVLPSTCNTVVVGESCCFAIANTNAPACGA